MPRISPRPASIPSPRIAIVGEAPGQTEEETGFPFMGASGQEFRRMLREAGIPMDHCYLTNLFLDRPPNNNISKFCCSKLEAMEIAAARGQPYLLPPIGKLFGMGASNWYIHPDKAPELDRLRQELLSVRPNVVIAAGALAAWALLGNNLIGKIRGAVAPSTLIPGLKVFPIYHPANILRNWKNRAITVVDLMKANRESEFPEIRRPKRELWLEPSIVDLYEFQRLYIDTMWSSWRDNVAPPMAVDIETSHGQITCIGFAPTKDEAIVVPFWDRRKPDWSYWPSPSDEVDAWRWVHSVLRNPDIPKVGQNFAYDMQYLWKTAGCPVLGDIHDTMFISHVLQPEMPKDLGFLGSVHTDEPAWKLMRKRSGDEMEKREE